MSEELNKEEVKEETKENIIEDNKEGKKPKNNKWLKIKRVAVLIIVMLIIGGGISFSNKIIVPPALEPIENIYIGKVKFTKECKKEIKGIQKVKCTLNVSYIFV